MGRKVNGRKASWLMGGLGNGCLGHLSAADTFQVGGIKVAWECSGKVSGVCNSRTFHFHKNVWVRGKHRSGKRVSAATKV